MNRILLLSLAIALASCSPRESIPHYAEQSDIYGLATAVTLTGDETEVVLEDYFMDVSRIDSIVGPPEFSIEFSNDKQFARISLAAQDAPPLSELQV